MSLSNGTESRRRLRLLPQGVASRMALTFLLLFGGASALLMGGVYLLTAHALRTQVDLAIAEDISLLRGAAQNRGPRGLAVQLVRQARMAGENQAVFLLTKADGTPIAGNLTHWPESVPLQGRSVVERDVLPLTDVTANLPPGRGHGGGLGGGANGGLGGIGPGWPHPMGPKFSPLDSNHAMDHMDNMRPPPWEPGDVRLVTLSLPGGNRLLVGRDMGAVEALLGRMAFAMRLGLFATALLALLGGWIMSRRFGRRLEGVTQASREIMGGDLSRRVPQGKGLDGDDFDQLSANLNAMLTRIESLMEGVRHVSDTIAHDLRTPLSRLRNRLESLQSDCAEETDREGIAHALREVDGLLSTFSALLRIAQVETGGRRMAFAPINLTALLTDVVDLYDAVAEDAGARLETDITQAAMVDGDRDLLFQAFANLMDNAVKFSPPEGTISLRLTQENGTPVVTLTDRGPGIPKADRKRVFERFARLDQSRTTPGNGLGLTMVGAVIEAHGGTITLDDAEGGGLTVTVRLKKPVMA
ncbi:MAG: HAMP domain-containing histidine kinase [Rhodospirillum sp.]|nr:HAMP domain-containing histidine kinase [Rhodospirillum sp.]MCF8488673.1 HAMP domain-containing histidine kinase [Rhodospirillum sp.]MCF8502559.1 HAMP domain-containing histidine kinase [Rhodospirillum sp.]